VRWESFGDPESHDYLPLYSWNNGEDWIPLSLILQQNFCTVDFDELPGGQACLIRVLASSGVATAVDTSSRFAVTRKGVRSLIITPADGEVVPSAAALLVGQAYDFDERTFRNEQLVWSSSLAGSLGQGQTLLVSLPPGSQVVTLTDEGSGASVAITIDAVPAQELPI
jgi:hypothetical protein